MKIERIRTSKKKEEKNESYMDRASTLFTSPQSLEHCEELIVNALVSSVTRTYMHNAAHTHVYDG